MDKPNKKTAFLGDMYITSQNTCIGDQTINNTFYNGKKVTKTNSDNATHKEAKLGLKLGSIFGK